MLGAVSEERYCSNCRAELPEGAASCPACGVYAGDVFDGRLPREKKRRGSWILFFSLVLLAVALFLFWPRTEKIPHAPLPVRVVKDRPGVSHRAPGASVSEAEAMMALRRALSASARDECIALIAKGFRDGGYQISASDSCEHRPLGQWRVDGKSRSVTRVK